MATATALSAIDTPLGQFDSEKVYDVKYINVNPTVADWQPKDEFKQELTDFPKLGLTVDHGYIIRLTWKRRATVAMRDGVELSEEQAERYESSTGNQLARYNAFDCYVSELILTDGPARRERLQRTYEQQKDEDQSTMYKSFETMIRSMTALIKGDTSKPDQVNMIAELRKMAKESPDQVRALIEMVKDEVDEGESDVDEADTLPAKKPGVALYGEKKR